MRTLALTLTALFLTACGSSSGMNYEDIDAVANGAKCDSFTVDDEPMMFAAKSGSCTLPSSDDVGISWFNSNDARDQYMDIGTRNGAVYVYGEQWIVECQDTDAQAAVAKTTKGETTGERGPGIG